MTVHSYHGDTHTEGLVDNCERCAEHAENPFGGLDDRNLMALLKRNQSRDEPRSFNEACAMAHTEDAYWIAVKIAQLLGWIGDF